MPVATRLRTGLRSIDALGRRALGIWMATRLATAVIALCGAWTLSGTSRASVEPFLDRWARWDVDLFRKIAEFGYQGYPEHYPDEHIVAFFPGLPIVLHVVHVVVPNWTVAGLLISASAGAVAAVFLAKLSAEDSDTPEAAGPRAVLYLSLSPYAVFLASGYSEALFLGFAIPGWWAARRGRWATAGVLVALAATVRVSGLFLAAGLVVEYVVQRRRQGKPLLHHDAAWLFAPAVTVGAFMTYLHSITGDWLAWQHTLADGWGRSITWPWQAFATTLSLAQNDAQGADFAWSWRAEIVALMVGLALTGLLVARRRFGEATYVGLSVAALATSAYYSSVTRATLLWFPLFTLLAAASIRRPWLHTAYLAVAAPLSAVFVLTFTSGHWAG